MEIRIETLVISAQKNRETIFEVHQSSDTLKKYTRTSEILYTDKGRQGSKERNFDHYWTEE